MIRKRSSRLVTLVTTSVLATMLLAVSGTAAKTPDWSIIVDRLPVSVAAGNDAGYFVTVSNNGTSTINAAKLSVSPAATPTATPTYFSGLTWIVGGPELLCTSVGQLVCELGTMSAGDSFSFTVAYKVPSGTSGTFDVSFFLEAGSGNVPGKNSSRGDALTVTAKTGIGSSQNFDAGFVVNEFTYETTGNLGRNNKQTTKLETTDSLIPVTVEDGISSYPCTDCVNLIGEWSVLNVNDGDNDDPIKVTIFIWGGSVPGSVGVDDIYLLHADGSGTATAITATCDASPPTNADCLESVTKVGNNYKIVAWLAQNGGLRGGY